MLIGAGRRLARHLARIRTGDDEPTPDALRSALREVVRHCLYGVDINDMAVELCKVALWMETLEPGKPLSFLDSHIQVGNSLIGVTPGLDISEIPDDAFQPKTGDDRTTATGLRRRNKKEREGQLAFDFASDAPQNLSERLAGWRARRMAALEEQIEDAVDQVQAKETAYAGYLQADEYRLSRWEYDLWTAAFFWPIPQGDAGLLPAPTQEVLRSVRQGKLKAHAGVLQEVRRLARQHQFFHWALQFPEVFDGRSRESGVGSSDPTAHSRLPTAHSPFPRAPGFDVILSNPPWERIKLQEKEWFAARSPEIANAPNAAMRKRLIEELLQEDPALHKAFQNDLRGAECESHFIRNSAKYPLCGRGDVNTYAVFAELARQVQAPTGRAGIIVPSGIATDDTTKYYFQEIMETGTLASLYDFENRRAIFPGVHRSYKFCLLTLRGGSIPTPDSRLPTPQPPPAEFVFFALDVDDLRDPERRFTLTAEEIALLNPNTRTCPIFRSQRDAELTKGIYRRVPVLLRDDSSTANTWGISFLRMFDMTNDSSLFRTYSELNDAGGTLVGNVFSTSEGRWMPVLEGKMVGTYDHRSASITIRSNNLQRQQQSVLTTELAHRDPYYVPIPYLWAPESAGVQRTPNYWKMKWFPVFKRVTASTNERTLVGCVIPWTTVSYTLYVVVTPKPNQHLMTGLISNLFSLIADYSIRQKTAQPSLPMGVVYESAILPPSIYSDATPWLGDLLLIKWLLPRVLELTYTAWDLEPFGRDVVTAWKQGVGSRESAVAGEVNPHSLLPTADSPLPPFRWDEERRFLLRCELDAAYFHLYGIARHDVDYIMETFPIVKRKDVKQHGEYRTKRVILEIYDAMAAAIAGGPPYQTRLDPPPADPRVAHPPKEQESP